VKLFLNYFQRSFSIITDLSTKRLDLTAQHHNIGSAKYKNTENLIQTWNVEQTLTPLKWRKAKFLHRNRFKHRSILYYTFIRTNFVHFGRVRMRLYTIKCYIPNSRGRTKLNGWLQFRPLRRKHTIKRVGPLVFDTIRRRYAVKDEHPHNNENTR